MESSPTIRLCERGVKVHLPETVHVDEDVDLARIEPGVEIHPGCRIRGAKTLIRAGSVLGADGPLTLADCQLGRKVELASGTVAGATFLDGAGMGPNAQVREGCLLEEGARGAHAVGLKQTILFPFVTLGSLINFCDCLMAGGTSRKDHSEVGSSYIHFNYTPNQDKATPSIMGDVPRGVMLREPPIFLGGQGGLVGPARIAYGTVIAAGTLWRGDIPTENQLVFGQKSHRRRMPFARGVYKNVDLTARKNVLYIAELWALSKWYGAVRSRFAMGDVEEALVHAAAGRIRGAISERIHRLGQVAAKAADSSDLAASKALSTEWPGIRVTLEEGPGEGVATEARDSFLEHLDETIEKVGQDYLAVIGELSRKHRAEGSAWLEGLIEDLARRTGFGGNG